MFHYSEIFLLLPLIYGSLKHFKININSYSDVLTLKETKQSKTLDKMEWTFRESVLDHQNSFRAEP